MYLSLVDAQALPLDDDSFDAVVSSALAVLLPAAGRRAARAAACRAARRLRPRDGLAPAEAAADPAARDDLQPLPDRGAVQAVVCRRRLQRRARAHISNPWNAQQYALASAARRLARHRAAGARSAPPPTAGRTLRSLLWLPVAIGRFGLSMAAFALLGPLQIINATIGMRKLRQTAPRATVPRKRLRSLSNTTQSARSVGRGSAATTRAAQGGAARRRQSPGTAAVGSDRYPDSAVQEAARGVDGTASWCGSGRELAAAAAAARRGGGGVASGSASSSHGAAEDGARPWRRAP